MLELLKETDSDFRARVVRALEVLEQPQNIKELETLLKTDKNRGALAFLPTRLHLAIARIKSRNLKGQIRLEAIAQVLGFSLTQIR